jgi:hypothetical protein
MTNGTTVMTNGTIVVENMVLNSLMPLNKVWLSLRRFS